MIGIEEPGMEKKSKSYSLEFKEQVLADVESGDESLIRKGVALVGLRGTAASMGRSVKKKVRAAVRGWADGSLKRGVGRQGR